LLHVISENYPNFIPENEGHALSGRPSAREIFCVAQQLVSALSTFLHSRIC
jgi:hypothetical protein